MAAEPIIQLENVSIGFGDHLVHRDISLSIYASEIVTILGPSGTGKTIILKLIMGLLTPDSGRVIVFGEDLAKLHERELLKKRSDIGMLFQGAALFDSLNVHENVAYSLREKGGYSEAQISEIVSEKLEIIGLPGIEHKFPGQLSGGQKKRVGLARALARQPRVMLFDEPTTGLDPTATRRIDDLILKLKQDYGITSVAVTHDIESARRISDRWVLVDDGTIAAQGAVSEVSARNEQVRDFVTGNWSDS